MIDKNVYIANIAKCWTLIQKFTQTYNQVLAMIDDINAHQVTTEDFDQVKTQVVSLQKLVNSIDKSLGLLEETVHDNTDELRNNVPKLSTTNTFTDEQVFKGGVTCPEVANFGKNVNVVGDFTATNVKATSALKGTTVETTGDVTVGGAVVATSNVVGKNFSGAKGHFADLLVDNNITSQNVTSLMRNEINSYDLQSELKQSYNTDDPDYENMKQLLKQSKAFVSTPSTTYMMTKIDDLCTIYQLPYDTDDILIYQYYLADDGIMISCDTYDRYFYPKNSVPHRYKITITTDVTTYILNVFGLSLDNINQIGLLFSAIDNKCFISVIYGKHNSSASIWHDNTNIYLDYITDTEIRQEVIFNITSIQTSLL